MSALAFWILFPGLLCALAYRDVKEFRIPNAGLLSGLAAALTLHCLGPGGAGFLSTPAGGLGALGAMAGAGLGLALFLPFYVVGAMGAGDVKLMAMVGAFLGVDHIVGAALAVLLAGGVLAVGVALVRGAFGQVLGNLRMLAFIAASRLYGRSGLSWRDGPPTAVRLPYGVAIAAGTLSYMGYVTAGSSMF